MIKNQVILIHIFILKIDLYITFKKAKAKNHHKIFIMYTHTQRLKIKETKSKNG